MPLLPKVSLDPFPAVSEDVFSFIGAVANISQPKGLDPPLVPKGARDAWAGVFAQELKAIRSSPLVLLCRVLEIGELLYNLYVSDCASGHKVLIAIYGIRPLYCHEAAHCPTSTHSHEFVGALTSFCLLAVNGHAPSKVVPYFCCASLIASI
uniref:Uncharacterized protein n=1 Tax=Amphimedon queenslandica TaxID=400682 RepID=A0A1X7VPL2_AMPQE